MQQWYASQITILSKLIQEAFSALYADLRHGLSAG